MSRAHGDEMGARTVDSWISLLCADVVHEALSIGVYSVWPGGLARQSFVIRSIPSD